MKGVPPNVVFWLFETKNNMSKVTEIHGGKK
jgi:hypothetical protein